MREHYLKLYNRLPYEIRIRAKVNFLRQYSSDVSLTAIGEDIYDAIILGFNWRATEEGRDYWTNICRELRYPSESTLFYTKYLIQ